MFGSIFYNFWAALIGFSIYFFSTLSDSSIPFNSLVSSSIAAAVSFLFMYGIRLFLGYVLYTPDDELFTSLDIENEQLREQLEGRMSGASDSGVRHSTVEFTDQSSEEIAKVVQTMMLQDDSAKK
ncbi:hypothetical protein [Ureibacillus sp. GCM10028918]|uniref:hypothetical protein n=1 Tax=Ureibacillus sp. GCM10028918 TaxID=3273429 RepID=UPI003613D781